MKDRMIQLIVVIPVCITFSIATGCFSIGGDGDHISKVHMIVNLDYNETMRLNSTDVENDMNEIGFSILLNKTSDRGCNIIFENNTPPTARLTIIASEWQGSHRAYMELIRNFGRDDRDEDDETDIKNEVMELCSEVATICNLTLDWSSADWTFYLQDHEYK